MCENGTRARETERKRKRERKTEMEGKRKGHCQRFLYNEKFITHFVEAIHRSVGVLVILRRAATIDHVSRIRCTFTEFPRQRGEPRARTNDRLEPETQESLLHFFQYTLKSLVTRSRDSRRSLHSCSIPWRFVRSRPTLATRRIDARDRS